MSLVHGWRLSKGLSLIEIMVALGISAILVLGLVEVFAASRTAYQLSSGLARVQENGRFALDFLQRDIRMAGHMGCVNDQARFLPENITPSRPALASTFLTAAQQAAGNYSAAPEALRFDMGVQGYDAKVDGSGAATASGSTIALATTPATAVDASAWQPALSAGMFAALKNPVQNSDVIVLRYFAPQGAQMATFTPGDPATITVDSAQAARLTEGDPNPGLFGITDCINAAVFEASTPLAGGSVTVKTDGLNKSGLLGSQSFVQGQAIVYRAESVVYYVGINDSGNPSLYRLRYSLAPGAASVTATNAELVEGIESLQLQYGQDSRTASNERPTGNIGSSAIANALLPVGDPSTAWRRVGLVQVGLVARSPEPAAAAQADSTIAPLSALGVKVTAPNDTRYRTVYEDSIALRNRLFGN